MKLRSEEKQKEVNVREANPIFCSKSSNDCLVSSIKVKNRP